MADQVSNGHQNNKSGKAIFAFAMVFVFLFFIYITFLHPHSSPDQVKSIVEENVTQEVPAAPEAEKTASNDVAGAEAAGVWVSAPEKVAQGKKIFETTCALCHGAGGLGDGPAGAALNPKPRNFVEGHWKKGGTPFALFHTISNGIEGSSMAAYKHLPESDRWALVHYVRSLSKNTPDATTEEIEAYKKSNK